MKRVTAHGALRAPSDSVAVNDTGAAHVGVIAHHGVQASTVYLPPLPTDRIVACATMLDFFQAQFPKIQPEIWVQRFADGLIHNAQGQAVAWNAPYLARQHLHYFRHIVQERRIPFEEVVLYQDAHLVVVDKPHFLPVTPSGRYVQETLLVRLQNKLQLPKLSPLHRLDRDTAGLVLFAVQPKERGAYQQLFHDRKIEKTYEAVAPFNPNLAMPLVRESRLEDSDIYMQMQEIRGIANSRTRIELIARLQTQPNHPPLAHYRLQPASGKRHQLRVHMAALGIPILNDGIYPVLTPEPLTMTDTDHAKPLQLLAKCLAFLDPITREMRAFESQRSLAWVDASEQQSAAEPPLL